MSSNIPAKIREAVEKRAKYVCEYCLIPQMDAHFIHHIDHILPRQHGGRTVLENLALACWRCNINKGTNVGTFDLETRNLTRFFNPRIDIWSENFHLHENGIFELLTAESRVTARILKFNDSERIEERRELIEAELY